MVSLAIALIVGNSPSYLDDTIEVAEAAYQLGVVCIFGETHWSVCPWRTTYTVSIMVVPVQHSVWRVNSRVKEYVMHQGV